jgi:hypothetical protein
MYGKEETGMGITVWQCKDAYKGIARFSSAAQIYSRGKLRREGLKYYQKSGFWLSCFYSASSLLVLPLFYLSSSGIL